MLITITVSIVALPCTTSLNTKPDGFAQIFGKLPMHESALLTFIQRLEVHFRSLQAGQPDARNRPAMKFNHIGIPVKDAFEGEIDVPHLKITVSDHLNNPYGIQWQRYWQDAPYPELVKTVPHVAFEVEDLEKELQGQKVIIEPNNPSPGVTVAFVEVNGAPVELMQFHSGRTK